MNPLEGFGPVYIINLERHADRREYIIKEMEKYGVEYTIVPAVDGRKIDLSNKLTNASRDLTMQGVGINAPNNLPNISNASSISHINAIKLWYETTKDHYGIFLEDDFSFDTVPFWKDKTWKDFQSEFPGDFDIMQLYVCYERFKIPDFSLRKRKDHDWSVVCYVMSRDYAKRFLDKHYIGGKYYVPAVFDEFIYWTDKAYTYQLFVPTTQFDSSIPNSLHGLDAHTRNITLSWWNMKNIGN